MSVCADLFKQYLDSKGFHYSASVNDNGDDIITFPYQGKDARLFFSGENGTYLSLYLVFENVPEDRITNAVFACNDINVKYKWVTYFLDKDRDIIIHDDAILSVDNAADEAFELMVRMFKICEETKPEVMKAIYG